MKFWLFKFLLIPLLILLISAPLYGDNFSLPVFSIDHRKEKNQFLFPGSFLADNTPPVIISNGKC